MIDYKKPTAQMLGRWQPFHDGHFELFKKILEKTGQVCIMVRDQETTESNPFNFDEIKKRIEQRLKDYTGKFEIIKVPNITNICYGRGVGYKIEEIVLPKEIQEISATKIREAMKNEI
jgi:phosphopantetheine adenylyltransferase